MNQEVIMATLCIRAFNCYFEENGKSLEGFEERGIMTNICSTCITLNCSVENRL